MQVLDQYNSSLFNVYNADCVEFTAGLPENSIDFSVYSPPYSSLYIYSESERDMGNCGTHSEFQELYRHLVKEKLRVTKPGRLTAIHVKDLVYYSNSSDKGDRGVYPFSDDCVRTHIDAGWSYHCRITIQRCPVREMTKSKPDGLLYKNFRGDCARNRVGMPEYLLVFRKWAEGMDKTPPVMHDYMQWREWAGEGADFVQDGHQLYGKEREYFEALDIWQNWANPIWFEKDLPVTDVLHTGQKDEDAERHLCPMPLNITDRAVRMWSNAGDLVYSPFTGIGSEGVASMRAGRRFIGTELKPEYYRQAVKNLKQAEESSNRLDI